MKLHKLDTHVHTSETSPCGKVSASELVHLYERSGYTGIVITDHYYVDLFDRLGRKSWEEKVEVLLQGYRNASKEADKLKLRVILGMEITFNESPNDYLVYGIDEDFLKNNPELYKLGLAEFKRLAEKNSLLVFQAHPFRIMLTRADPKHLDGVEIYNGNPRHDSMNHLAYSFALKHNLKMLSGSDFHQLCDLARGGVLVPEIPANSMEFVNFILNDKIVDFVRT